MSRDYTNDALISNVRLRAMLPDSQNLYTDERILSLADDELQTVIFPMIMNMKGEYFVAVDEQAMTSSLEYPIPGDAVGIKIKDVYWRDPNWPDNQPDTQIPLISIQDLTGQAAGLFNYLAYYIQNNSIFLTNTQSGQLLKIRYYKRAAKLVPNDEAAQVVDASTSNIELTNVPSDWEVGTVLQCCKQDPPFTTQSDDIAIVSIAGNIVTLLNSGPTFTMEDGDWLSLTGETPIAQVTPEAHPILAQSVVVKCLEGLGDPNMPVAQAKFEQLRKNFVDTMTPRADGQAKKIIQRNGPLFWNKVTRGSWGAW